MPLTSLTESGNIRGIMYMVVGIFFMTAMDATAKLLVEANYSVIQMLAIRGAILMPLLLIWILARGESHMIKTRRIGGHALRIGFGIFAPLLFFQSLKELPLADATVIFFISPFVMTALSVPLFKEKVGIHRWSAIFIGFGGVLFVLQPTSGLFKVEAFMVLIASLCYCGVMLTGRVLSRTETTFTIIFYSNLGLLVASGIAAIFIWQPMPLFDLGLVALMALLSLAGNVCLVKSFAVGEVGVITPFEYTALVWAVLLGYFVFSDFPALNVWIGVVIIAGSGLYMIYRENLRR
jgi:drug/metabolite transporter (DMT)-like permease